MRVATAPAEAIPSPRFGDGPPPTTAPQPVNNALLAVVLFMGSEVMLFMSLFGTLVLYRTASVAWPPPAEPMLPIGVTFANTAVLLASGVAMNRAYNDLRDGELVGFRRSLALTAVLGSAFLLVQGYEWVNLIRHGLSLSASIYGSTFYTLIGLHGVHVAGAVVWVVGVLIAAARGRYSAQKYVGVQVCSIYWYFVCGLWVVLFGAVYLA